MPDLNLIDEGGFEEAPVPVAPPAKKKSSSSSSSSGGGGIKIIIIVLVAIILAGGVLYFLNQRGIVKLWGKKKSSLAQLQEEPFLQEPTAEEMAQEQAAQEQKQADTAVALLETPPIDEKAATPKESDAGLEGSGETESEEEADETEPTSKLSEMKGEFTIQVVAYSEKRKAVETSKNLEIAGYPSFVEKVPMKGGDWYTVRIGRYPSRDAAQKAVKTFAAELQTHFVIDKIRGK